MNAVKPTPSDGYDVKRANPADVEAIFQPLRIGRLQSKIASFDQAFPAASTTTTDPGRGRG
jgi:hypothetical protein